jgi:hypothetical protein
MSLVLPRRPFTDRPVVEAGVDAKSVTKLLRRVHVEQCFCRSPSRQ